MGTVRLKRELSAKYKTETVGEPAPPPAAQATKIPAAMTTPYQALHSSQSHFWRIRGLPYHVRTWGEPGPTQVPWVMLHGWMDVAASYQFLVDALDPLPFVLAPDWRGFGLSASPTQDHFTFPDYLSDLEGLLDHCQALYGHQVFNLIGHSMGGNVATLYAGLRPLRIHKLVNLEGFGLPPSSANMAPERLRRFMNEVKQLHQGELALKTYDSAQAVAERLIKTNPRLALDKALWLAQHWAQPNASGQWQILGSAAHKVVSAHLYQVDEVLAVMACIQAPTLSVHAQAHDLHARWGKTYTFEDYRARMSVIPDLAHLEIEDASHMLHHDQPRVLAQALTAFLSDADHLPHRPTQSAASSA